MDGDISGDELLLKDMSFLFLLRWREKAQLLHTET